MAKRSIGQWGLAGVVLLVAACAAGPATPPAGPQTAARPDVDWGRAETISVRMTDFAFAPARLSLRAGTPVRLHLVNGGSGAHDFSAPAFFATVAYPAGAGAPDDGKITLAKDETADLLFVPTAPGTYPLECTRFLHTLFGMTGEIDVEARQ